MSADMFLSFLLTNNFEHIDISHTQKPGLKMKMITCKEEESLNY